MISVVDQGHISALMLLDLSAAFDTIDHSILMKDLKRRFNVEGNALGWLAEFLYECSQVIRVGESESDSLPLHFGVPQGSVLSPKTIHRIHREHRRSVCKARYVPPFVRGRYAGRP